MLMFAITLKAAIRVTENPFRHVIAHGIMATQEISAIMMKMDRLSIKLAIVLITISALPLLLFGLSAYKKHIDTFQKKAMSNLETIAVQNTLIINKYCTDTLNELRLIAASLKGLDENRTADLIRSIQSQHSAFEEVHIAGMNGKIRHSTGDRQVHSDVAGQEWFKDVVNGGIFAGDVESGDENDRREFIMAVPIHSLKEQLVGVLMAHIDLTGIAEIMKATPIGSTGEIFLLNDQGVFLTATRVGKVRPGDKIPSGSLSGYYEETHKESIDYRGEKVMRVRKNFRNPDWTLIVEQDSAELFDEIRVFRNISGSFAGLFIILVVAGSYLTSVKISRLLKTKYEREKELELQLIQKDKLASMGLLTAGIAHELNTPLANALLSTQILKEDMRQAHPVFIETLASIEEEIKRGGTIVRNLLDFSRQSHTDSTVTDINDVLSKLLDIAQKLCSEKRIVVKRTFANRIPLANGNASILHQVFMNIVSNAVEAMESGGTLTVRTRYVEANQKVIAEIGDTGPGIPEENIGDVFDPFFTTKASEDGMGLGLAISYTMIRKMGGDIRVTSSGRKKENGLNRPTGTIFSVELPAHNGENPFGKDKEGNGL